MTTTLNQAAAERLMKTLRARARMFTKGAAREDEEAQQREMERKWRRQWQRKATMGRETKVMPLAGDPPEVFTIHHGSEDGAA